MCVYLLRMREFYRWQHAIPPGVSIDAETLGNWVHNTEAYWDTIENTAFRPVTVNGREYQPFDIAPINALLADTNLIYSAGLGRLGQPHFMLAERVNASATPNHIICGTELARDSITLPAMSQNGTILIRRQSLTQMLWQMFEEWSIRQPPGPMARLADHYHLKNNAALLQHLELAAADLSDLLLHHEIGEQQAGELLGEQYAEMTHAFNGKPGEAHLRAVRDLLADTLASWPFIVRRQSLHSLDFWLAGLTGIRQELFKPTPLYSLLQSNSGESRMTALVENLDTEKSRWHHLSARLLAEYDQHGTHFKVVKTLNNSLLTTL